MSEDNLQKFILFLQHGSQGLESGHLAGPDAAFPSEPSSQVHKIISLQPN